MNKKYINAGLMVALLMSMQVLNTVLAETYIYQGNDGTRWITDHQLSPDQYTFIDHYGRPTATKSCKGTTPAILERRASSIMPNVNRYAGLYSVDPELVKAVIRVESCFDRHAVSQVGARGLMQLMPATAGQYGVQDSFHADDNIRAGVKHLSELLDKYSNNLTFSLAAYNAGGKAVEKYKGIPPYKETQDYVKKVMNFYEEYKNSKTAN